MEKVILDKERCIGCGLCVSVAPETFDFEEGLSSVKNEEVTDEAREVKEMCPTSAIDIVEEEKEDNNEE